MSMIPCGPCCPDPKDKEAMRQYVKTCWIGTGLSLVIFGVIFLVMYLKG